MNQTKKKRSISYQCVIVSKEEFDESRNQKLYKYPKIRLPGYDQNLLPNEWNSRKLRKYAL